MTVPRSRPSALPSDADHVREMLERGCDCDIPAICENTDSAIAALSRLVAAAEQAATQTERAEAAEREREALANRLRDAPLGGEGSHWAGCWQSHIDCARARVAALETALEERIEAGHNDTCQSVLETVDVFPCNCGHVSLLTALSVGAEQTQPDGEESDV